MDAEAGELVFSAPALPWKLTLDPAPVVSAAEVFTHGRRVDVPEFREADLKLVMLPRMILNFSISHVPPRDGPGTLVC